MLIRERVRRVFLKLLVLTVGTTRARRMVKIVAFSAVDLAGEVDFVVGQRDPVRADDHGATSPDSSATGRYSIVPNSTDST